MKKVLEMAGEGLEMGEEVLHMVNEVLEIARQWLAVMRQRERGRRWWERAEDSGREVGERGVEDGFSKARGCVGGGSGDGRRDGDGWYKQ